MLRRPSQFQKRLYSVCSLIYENYGDPAKVVKLQEHELPNNQLDGNSVVCQTLAAPINPADLNQIQGVYPIKPKLPAVGGNEGVSEVVSIGPGVSSLRVGDWVLPAQAGSGTWRSHFVAAETDLVPVSNSLPLPLAATFLVNPPTAYRMLKDFCQLAPGDFVMQNGANSHVGIYVIQIAKSLGVRTVNIVRNRPNFLELKSELARFGADYVFTDGDLKSGAVINKTLSSENAKIKLALNCVGGKNAMYMTQYLAQDGKMVTYGGMSRQPLMVPTASLIFKNVTFHGFWMSHWYTIPGNQEERSQMYRFLTDLALKNELHSPHFEQVPVKQYLEALKKSVDGGHAKQLLIF